ncbi:PhoX family protein [Pseudonocardia yunnanensis]|uniref:Alkaline phosphatase PhoX n=1 Tax=Pseudonocardia yunnanensis TaxID=58107 RepID=A0ABW4EPA9_9PSEU
MTNGMSRRGFLRGTAAAGAGVVLLGASEVLLTAPNAAAAPAPAGVGYGPLVADPAKRLALPEGFKYTVVTEAGVTKLESGEFTPSNHDGTGAFKAKGGGTVLVNNHELGDPFANTKLPVPHLEGLTYDEGSAGGCTIIETDKDGKRVREFVGIAGTSTNCAGGITPWDTWLTCEETEGLAGSGGRTKDHGYVFEVDPFDQEANKNPQPIKALGRFAHEAAVVDPKSGNILLTEDAGGPNGLLYRWEAPKGFKPKKGGLKELGPTDGVLAAMRCTDKGGAFVDDLSRATEIGTTYSVTWTEVPDRDARTTSTRKQFTGDQVTRGHKLEGAWWGDNGAYIATSFARSEDSPVEHDGQVWFYDPKRETFTLKVRFGVNPNPDQDGAFDGPDNISVSPWGGLIVAEDGEGVQHLLGISEKGESFPMARNELGNGSEFTGPVYSNDKKVLFGNIQTPGIMFAITGPWKTQK